MKTEILYTKLLEAYSDKNLNRIAGMLIQLYQAKQYVQIRTLSNKIEQYVEIDEENNAKLFSKLMMLYHPDRGEYYRNKIDQLFSENKQNDLEAFSHILQLENMEGISSFEIDEDIEYDPEYFWEAPKTGFSFHTDQDVQYGRSFEAETDYDRSFYNAVKIRMYGNTETEFPSYYLEDIEDVEYAECQIEFLDGIENCIHALVLNLSRNEISDLTPLWDLINLEELYLANNYIANLDAISNLINLTTIDLSHNEIDDISPLFDLEQLEYVNLVGNNIPKEQIEKLKEIGVLVVD